MLRDSTLKPPRLEDQTVKQLEREDRLLSENNPKNAAYFPGVPWETRDQCVTEVIRLNNASRAREPHTQGRTRAI